MPRRDGTGPAGQGAATGRGLGQCTGVNAPDNTGRYGRNIGRFSRGTGLGRFFTRNSKEALQDEKRVLKSRMDAIDRILDKETDDR